MSLKNKLKLPMNNKIYTLLLALGLISLASCEKDTPQYLPYESYAYSEPDEDGGDWVPVLQESGAAIEITAPESTDSQSYLDEFEDMKEAMASMTSEQKKAVKYWTNNPAIPWNEIALELIAKYNLIPGPNA